MQKARRWCFTINNPEDHGGIMAIESSLQNCDQVKFFIMELEHGDENAEEENQKTPHLQGYLEYSNATTRAKIENILMKGAYVAVAKESREKNILYCRKEVLEGSTQYFSIKGMTEEQAVAIAQKEKEEKKPYNRRKTVKYTKDFITDIETMKVDEIKEKYPSDYFLHWRNIEMIKHNIKRSIPPQTPSLKMKNYWIYGNAGTGKTSWVHSKAEEFDFKIYQKGLNKWWDGFEPGEHEVVLIDDFIPQTDEETKAYLKKWADRNPCHEQIKGGFVDFHCSEFCLVVTSNYTIDDCYYGSNDAAAIKRRFQQISFNPEDHDWNWKPECYPIMPYLLLKKGVDPSTFGIDITDPYWQEDTTLFHYSKPVTKFEPYWECTNRGCKDQMCSVTDANGNIKAWTTLTPNDRPMADPREGYNIMNKFGINNFAWARRLKQKGEHVSSEDEEPDIWRERPEKAPKELFNVPDFKIESENEESTTTEEKRNEETNDIIQDNDPTDYEDSIEE